MNLLSAALRSLFAAFINSPANQEVKFGGVLWYQGENDSSLEEMHAASYGKRFENFLGHLDRLCKSLLRRVRALRNIQEAKVERLPIVTVAITTTRNKDFCPHKEIIRAQQLDIIRQDCYNHHNCLLAVVDAFGLPLIEDNIHVSIQSIFHIGVALSDTYSSLIDPVKLCHSNTERNYCAISVVSDSMITPVMIAGNELYEKTKAAVTSELSNKVLTDSLVLNLAMQKSFSSHSRSLAPQNGPLPILRTGLKAANFIYGELDFLEFCRVLSIARIEDCESFVDLGCGSGILVAGACLSGFHFRRVSGIDLNHSKILECKEVMRRISCSTDSFPDVNIIEKNFLDEVSWLDYDVVYTCATCFASDQMEKLVELFYQLRQGVKIIIVDKEPFSSNSLILCADKSRERQFTQIASCQCKTSWGYADVFVYVKL
jgi:hypothetical protein